MEKNKTVYKITKDSDKVTKALFEKLKKSNIAYQALQAKKIEIEMELHQLKKTMSDNAEKEKKKVLRKKYKTEYEKCVDRLATCSGKTRERVYTRIKELETLLGIKADYDEELIQEEEFSEDEDTSDIDEHGNIKDFVEEQENESGEDREFTPNEEQDYEEDHVLSQSAFEHDE